MIEFQNLVISSILLSASPLSIVNLASGTFFSPFSKSSSALSLRQHPSLPLLLEVFPLRVECSRQVEKVAVHIVVGPLYKVLKNCLLQACDVFDVKMIQIWTFPAAPSTERVPSLAERVAYLRYSINLRLFNWRVPALIYMYSLVLCLYEQRNKDA